MQSNNTKEKADFYLPHIEVKNGLKKVIVSGRSRMPDPGTYYTDLTNKLAIYFNNFRHTLILDVYFDYINSGSSKWLLYVFSHLDKLLKNEGGLIELNWIYDEDDETILERGQLLKSQVSFPVNLIEHN